MCIQARASYSAQTLMRRSNFEANLIDLHAHILPGVDDGAGDLTVALDMARAAVADGTTIMACTPHFYPGVYDNHVDPIAAAVESLQGDLDRAAIPLRLVMGGDVHITPDLPGKIKRREVPTLNGSRYILVEPPHNILPPRIENIFFDLQAAGYQPILTHPERMRWIESRYDLIDQLHRSGVWMQLTASAITGGFGPRAKYWSLKMLRAGMVHIVASDAHNNVARPPGLATAFQDLCYIVGTREAHNLIQARPDSVLRDAPQEEVPFAGGASMEVGATASQDGFWRRLMGLKRT